MVAARKILQVSVVGMVALVCCIATILLVQENTVVPQLSLATALRAEDVAVYLKASSAEDAEKLLHFVRPELHEGIMPPVTGSGAFELAILIRGEDKRWITQRTTRTESIVGGTGTGWIMRSDEPRIGTLFTAAEYRRMVREQSPVVWMRTDALRYESEAADVLLAAMLSPYSSLQWSDATRTLTLIRKQRHARSNGASWMPTSGSNVSYAYIQDDLLGSRVSEMYAALAAKDPGMAEGWSGVLRHQLQTWLGQDAATLAAQLPPFLHAVRIEHGSGGLAGAVVLRDANEETLRSIEEGFAAIQPQTTLRSLALQKHERVDIAVDTDAMQREVEERDGWSVLSIRSRSSATELSVARRANWTVLGTERALVLSMISQQTAPATAGGGWSGDAFAAATTRFLPALQTREPTLFWLIAGQNRSWKFIALPDADVVTLSKGELD